MKNDFKNDVKNDMKNGYVLRGQYAPKLPIGPASVSTHLKSKPSSSLPDLSRLSPGYLPFLTVEIALNSLFYLS
jgi:hypothetical protein